MLIFVHCQPPSMDLEVLVLVLPLVLTLKPFQVLHMLLLKPEFEVLQLLDLLLIIVDGLRHFVPLRFHKLEFHLDRLFGVRFPVPSMLFILKHLLSVDVGRLLDFKLARADPLHGVILPFLQFSDLVQVECLHLLAERLHPIAVARCLLNPHATELELPDSAHLSL